MSSSDPQQRHIGLMGAAGVGIGAIVGGGILALAGAAFAATGPSAILAFALNGLIAILTALSFAEVASKFPQSGGTYTFAKKVLTVEAAFTVGWVVWFASIVAGVLYALGFGQFAAVAAAEVCRGLGRTPPDWLGEPSVVRGLAILATSLYAASLLWKSSGGGQWANVGKVAVFAVLIVCGFWGLRNTPPGHLGASLQPFFARGAGGLFQAMGFTFIALQGFDLIAAVGGEIREPQRTIPKAMLLSLGCALLIYLPLLFVVSTVGMPVGRNITEASRENAETIVAIAAQNYLGVFGFWLVMVAAILSMLSALQANLLAASRVAMAMSRDRTLPRLLSVLSRRNTPATAVLLTAAIVAIIIVLLPNVAAAGAASSLIFLITFALAHWIAILVRQRSQNRPPPFRVPLFPLVPVAGGLACVALAIYQGVAVPSAGMITAVWLTAGGLLFLGLFARRARLADASHAAMDPELVQLRGKSPLVLVPIVNPENARGLVAVASALAPPEVGRVLLLTVVVAERDWKPSEHPQPLRGAQEVLGEAIAASVEAGLFPESLATVAAEPWPEIARVARVHRCESLLLGFSHLSEDAIATPLDLLLNRIDCDAVVLRAPQGWQLENARRILVPMGGHGGHDRLRARLLSSFSRAAQREITLLRILPTRATAAERRQVHGELAQMGHDLCFHEPRVVVTGSDTAVDEVAAQAAEHDLVVLGIQRINRRQKLFGQFALQVAHKTSCPMLLIGRGR